MLGRSRKEYQKQRSKPSFPDTLKCRICGRPIPSYILQEHLVWEHNFELPPIIMESMAIAMYTDNEGDIRGTVCLRDLDPVYRREMYWCKSVNPSNIRFLHLSYSYSKSKRPRFI